MDFVDITLAGHDYKLRFTPDDIQDVCRRLTQFQPPGAGKVTPPVLGQLLVNLDPDAFQFCFWAGLRHITEYKHLDPADAQKLVSQHIKLGGQYTELRRPIFRALVKCGLGDFTPIMKILDEEAARLTTFDGVSEPAAPEDQKSGNSPMSLTRSSMPSSSVGDSGSSM